MTDLAAQARAFMENKERERRNALALCAAATCGIDANSQEKMQPTRARVERLLERERQKGLRGHWSYDLNRHIALKHLRDAIAETEGRRPDRVAQNERAGRST